MLLLLIALVWLAVVIVVVVVCQAAARGDAARGHDERLLVEPIYDGLAAWDRETAAWLRSEWLPRHAREGHAGATRPAAAGVPGRRGDAGMRRWPVAVNRPR